MLDKVQFRELIETALRRLNMYNESAVNLLLGTAAQESRFGTYLKQLGGGPAMGIFQMEPATEKDCWDNYLSYRDNIVKRITDLSGITGPNPEALQWNLYYSIAMCRVRYYRVPTPLPNADDIAGLAAYWKQNYNTPAGAGTVNEFIQNYNRYVGA